MLLLAQPNTRSSKLSALTLILYNIQWMDWFVCALLCSDLSKSLVHPAHSPQYRAEICETLLLTL